MISFSNLQCFKWNTCYKGSYLLLFYCHYSMGIELLLWMSYRKTDIDHIFRADNKGNSNTLMDQDELCFECTWYNEAFIADNFSMLLIHITGSSYDCIDKWCYSAKWWHRKMNLSKKISVFASKLCLGTKYSARLNKFNSMNAYLNSNSTCGAMLKTKYQRETNIARTSFFSKK